MALYEHVYLARQDVSAQQVEELTNQLTQVLADITRRTQLPPQLPAELADELPESGGVYRFYGEGDTPLYVGKAANLRERVLEVIDGVSYPSPMPPFAAQLSDADVADIANHERTAWGNQAKLVTAGQVKALR